MINFLGKFFVLLHTFISLLAMTWAIGLFLQFTDWGWKEPKQELDGRLASEFDKSAAALRQSMRVRDQVLAPIAAAQVALTESEGQYPKNHLFYLQELEKLRGEPLLPEKASFLEAKGAIEVKEIKGPGLPLDTGKVTGKPILDAKIEGLDKPLVEYRKDLEKLKEDAVKEEKKIEDVLAKTARVTYDLTGMDDSGKKITIGLYDLVDAEYGFLAQARKEFEELKPIWAETLEDARRYTERRLILEKTLTDLKAAAAKR